MLKMGKTDMAAEGTGLKINFRLLSALLCFLFFLIGCAHHKKLPFESVLSIYTAEDKTDSLLFQYAPWFIAHDFQNEYNRIGKPTAEKHKEGKITIFVDPGQPVIYAMEKDFSTGKGIYKNLIYRVHFPKVPYSLIPFNLSAGNNVGLMVVITLNHDQRPILVSTVHTCGCYLAIIPTTDLPRDNFIDGWKEEVLNVYGEKLPAILDFSGKENPRLLVSLRPEVHRVMHLTVFEEQVISNARNSRFITSPMISMNSLEKLPFNDDYVSFFHEKGILQGYVKGSVKPWESIFLSLISLDLFVGTDKAYDDPNKTGNLFYTSLKPWNRNKSNMWNFSEFLAFWGWEL